VGSCIIVSSCESVRGLVHTDAVRRRRHAWEAIAAATLSHTTGFGLFRTRHASDEICFYRALQAPGPCPELKNNNIRVQGELCLAGEEFVPEVQAAPNQRVKYSEREAAEYLGVSLSTLRRKRAARSGPDYVRIDRLIQYRKHALDDYLDKHTVRCNGK